MTRILHIAELKSMVWHLDELPANQRDGWTMKVRSALAELIQRRLKDRSQDLLGAPRRQKKKTTTGGSDAA